MGLSKNSGIQRDHGVNPLSCTVYHDLGVSSMVVWSTTILDNPLQTIIHPESMQPSRLFVSAVPFTHPKSSSQSIRCFFHSKITEKTPTISTTSTLRVSQKWPKQLHPPSPALLLKLRPTQLCLAMRFFEWKVLWENAIPPPKKKQSDGQFSKIWWYLPGKMNMFHGYPWLYL